MLVPNFSDAGRSSTPLNIGIPLHLFKPRIQRPVTVSGFSCQLMVNSGHGTEQLVLDGLCGAVGYGKLMATVQSPDEK